MVEQPAANAWRRVVRTRLLIVGAIFALWSVGIVGRLVDLQVYQHQEFQALAERQQMRLIEVPARRGEFLDRHGRLLAYSVDGDAVIAVPADVQIPAATAARLCEALGDCGPAEVADLTKRLDRHTAYFAYVRRQVSIEQARRVSALKLEGIGLMAKPRRFYPNRELAAHLLGYVGVDGNGLSGLEATYDRTVRGRSGMVLVQNDALQHTFSRVGDPPVPGATLELTIDEYLQHIAERELQIGVKENNARGGSVVIMDPTTGEILAMANEPTFNPNAFGKAPEDERRNRAVQDVYEPGSTFKIVTASAALDEKVMSPGDMIDTGAGQYAFGSRLIRDTTPHWVLSFVDVIVKSSNIGAAKIGFRIGADRLGRFVRRYGFGTRLSPDFPSENAGIVWDPAKWTDSTLASVSMGYEIGVTPLQMAAAASAVANGGELLQPRVLRAVIEGNRRAVVPRKVIRRAVTPETAAELTSIMEGVVERGTAKTAAIEGFTVAGKTGTAGKLVNGHYSKTDYNSSFVGFVPSRSPVLTIIVVIDSPHGHGYYGGVVSAPVFKRIAEDALRHLAVCPTINPVPPVLVRHPDGAVRVAGPAVPLTILPPPGADASGQIVLPELRGLSGREALRVLARLGLSARLAGDGIVLEQYPSPGTPLEQGGSCKLGLGRQPNRDVNPGLRP
ncbi:MAG TPA: penicillin-binding protein [Vicinamibacterales bacterium]|jgi:cell division protein FtsI (penicillin-binding protein 3)